MNEPNQNRYSGQTKALIGLEWIQPESTFELISPSSTQVIAEVANCGTLEAQRAADESVSAFKTWSRTMPHERAKLLGTWAALMERHERDLARLIALEMGKPVTEALGEVRYAIGFLNLYAGEATRIHGETFSSPQSHKRLFATRHPVGPVFGVTPWNFPAAMVTRKLGPALAAGCTFILKPAEQSPLTALRLAELWLEAGGPRGVFQVLPCHDPVPVSRVLMNDQRIRKLTFTGSTEVGRLLTRQAADTLKRVSMELGGHAPYIVFNDADIDQAVRDVVLCKFRNAGQTCVCTNRIYVQREIHLEFSQKLTEAVGALRVGDPLDETTQIGPLVDAAGLEKVQAHVQDALQKGATATVGGTLEHGLFFKPTVLTGVTKQMLVMQEETFGPVAPIIVFDSETEVLEAANAMPFGLAAYLWTRDLSRAVRVSEALEYGIVGLNDPMPSTPAAPFGGVKDSGYGREGGHWGLHEYLYTKFTSLAIEESHGT